MQQFERQEALITQRCWKSRLFFDEFLSGRALPDGKINLVDFGGIPLVTIGDSAFPRFSWLIKCYNENTRDPQQRYCSVAQELFQKIHTEWWHFLYKKIEAKPENFRYIIMACIALHHLCIAENDLCKPRW